MCDLTENGWADHKKLVYHKIDANTEYLEALGAKQDTILETIRTGDSKDMKLAMERARFEARMEERMSSQQKGISRVEKVLYGGGTVIVVQIVLNLFGVT